MSNNYTSSIIKKYGDTDRVSRDASVISEILARQGTSFLIDILAEKAGSTANRFKMNKEERETLSSKLQTEFNEALAERL